MQIISPDGDGEVHGGHQGEAAHGKGEEEEGSKDMTGWSTKQFMRSVKDDEDEQRIVDIPDQESEDCTEDEGRVKDGETDE